MLTPLYTAASGPGYAAAQTHPSQSLGGFASTTEWRGGIVGDLFGPASAADALAARPDYRCLYLYNPDPSALAGLRLYVLPVTVGGTLAVGVDPRPVTHVDSLSPQAVDVATAFVGPPGVGFSAPLDYGSGVVVGDLPGETPTLAGAGRAVWLRRTPGVTTGSFADACDLVAATAGGIVWTRRVYWQVEPVVAGLVPPAPQRVAGAVPRPTPFLRVSADFLSREGARITWEIDRTLNDPDPYDFQLQTSRSGVPSATDWTDVGEPVRDAAALYDVGVRLWGATADLFYRVVLTTGAATYISRPANVFGVLDRRNWLYVDEILRKERLYQRELVGSSGFLLKAKRYGTRCVCVNQTTGEINNSSCPLCFGTGKVGGYHTPVPMSFVTVANPAAEEKVAYNESLGTVKPITITGRIVADVPIVTRDVWVIDGSDERYYVKKVSESASWMSVPVVYEIELHAAPRSDVVYEFPLVRAEDDVPNWLRPAAIQV